MKQRSPDERDAEVLPDTDAKRLLTRASELDATGATVAELRAAATEAGISPRAFDAALAEMDGAEHAQVPAVPRRTRGRPIRAIVGAVVALAAIGALYVGRRVAPTTADAQAAGPLVENTIVLRCLTSGRAAELILPFLRNPANTVVTSPANAPGVLRIRATPAQMERVRSVLELYERPGSPACPAAPAPPAR